MSRLIASISARVQSGSELNLSELFFNLANDIICRVAFGKRFITGSGKGERKHELDKVLTETQALLAGFCIGDFFPEWGWVHSVSGTKRRLERNLKDLREVCDEIINEHLEKREVMKSDEKLTGNNKEDFVDVLVRVRERDDLEVPISDDNLKALVLDMFVAGTDTTSSTLEWTMTQLVRHPKIMKQAQDEVRKIGHAKGKIEGNDLANLHYMKAVIKETMRLNPPVPLLVPRESMEDCVLNSYKIPAQTRVLINTYAIGRDPESWEDPLEFKPQRFLKKEIDFKGQDFRFLPFGGGRRGCPGYAFGLATVEICLARILYHFDWELPKKVGVNDLDLEEVFGLATRKKSALVLVPKIPEIKAS